MKKREPVEKIMSADLVTVNITNTLFDVKEIFDTKKIRHLPVVSGEKVVGLISKTDFYRATYGIGQKEVQEQVNNAIFHTLKIEDIMTKDIVTVSNDSLIHEVAEIFAGSQFNALPVLEGGKLKGIVTTTDIIKYLLEQY